LPACGAALPFLLRQYNPAPPREERDGIAYFTLAMMAVREMARGLEGPIYGLEDFPGLAENWTFRGPTT
jgi:hypothetical protein